MVPGSARNWIAVNASPTIQPQPKGKTIMKSLKSYLLIAVLSLSTVLVPSAFANATQPVRGIDVIVKKNPGSAARQHATVNADGSANVNLSAAGKYTITYADGPMKGKVLWSGEVRKAESVSAKIDGAYLKTTATQ
jgi:hypothetical protein